MGIENNPLSITADIGSTNGRWIMHHKNTEVDRFATDGFNPYHSGWDKLEVILKSVSSKWGDRKVEHFNFFGAGIADALIRDKVQAIVFKHFFSVHTTIASDIDLAVNAFPDVRNQCVVILGTGCNAVYCENNRSMKHIIPPLGFAIGDEGSGAYFGKKLISAYFYNRLDEELNVALSLKYNMERSFVLNQVYNNSAPGKYLADFFPFMIEYKDHPIIAEIIDAGLNDHIEKIIIPHPHSTRFNYTGSVAHTLSTQIFEKYERNNLSLGLILKDPLEHFIKNID